jgi:hypothetical protein
MSEQQRKQPPAPTGPSPAHTAFRIVVALENADDYDDAVYAAEQTQGALRGQGYKAVAVVDTEQETAAAVAAQGALPVPVGDQPQPLDDARLAEIKARVEAASKGPWKVCEDYSDVLDGDGHQIISHFHDGDGQFTAHAREDVPALLAEVERLKAERHTTNEALTDAAETLRANRDRIAELEENLRAVNAGWSVARGRIAEVRTEALAEAKGEVVEWLVKKAHEGTEVSRLADKVQRGAIRIFHDAERSAAAPATTQHYDKVPDPLDGCHWCACGNRWPCQQAEEAAS